MKIKKIKLKNFRGAREVSLDLDDSQSALLYGDNASGKSSFLDALEWFISGKVAHLAGEEINLKDALKNVTTGSSDESYNVTTGPSDESSVEVHFSTGLSGKRILNGRGGGFLEPNDDKLNNTLNTLYQEQTWIRGHNLVDFILKTKTNRLKDISTIVGYEPITELRETFVTSANSLKKQIQNRGFEQQKSSQQSIIEEICGKKVFNESKLYSEINTLVQDHTSAHVVDEKTLQTVINDIKDKLDQKHTKYIEHLDQILKQIQELQNNTIQDLNQFIAEIVELQEKQETVKNISRIKLYEEAKKILSSSDSHDKCPLCEQHMDKEKLIKHIRDNLQKLEDLKKKTFELNEDKRNIVNKLNHNLNISKSIKTSLEKHKELNKSLTNIKKIIRVLDDQVKEIDKNILNIEVSKLNAHKKSQDQQDHDDTSSIIESIHDDINGLITQQKKNLPSDAGKQVDLIRNIDKANAAFNEWSTLEQEHKLIEKDLDALGYLKKEIVSRQERAIKKLCSEISKNVNDFYKFMMGNEKIKDIKLDTVTDRDKEFVGVEVNVMFYDKSASPKQFLSESYMNCLGLGIFLSSAKRFNKTSKFIVLDDIISSFDSIYRERFADWITDKEELSKFRFSNHQFIVLTHEDMWLESMYIKVEAKKLNWYINEVSDDEDIGTKLSEKAVTRKKRIEQKIKNKDADGLGNEMRQYFEQFVKELCASVKALVPFKFNNQNERRGLRELLKSLEKTLVENYNFDRKTFNLLEVSLPLLDKASHPRKTKIKTNDLTPIYQKVEEFVKKCRCDKCKKPISKKDEKELSCKCGEIKYSCNEKAQ